MNFYYHKLSSAENNTGQLLNALHGLQQTPARLWGVFSGLFGPASNELLVVTSGAMLPAPAAAFVGARESWQATARPTDATACQRDGLYVFRSFHIRTPDIDEFVALSTAAWGTFENANDFRSEPMGLFVADPEHGADAEIEPAALQHAADGDVTRMQLVTWYDGFASWQRSRQPPAQAAENFQRRATLTLRSAAAATRLVR